MVIDMNDNQLHTLAQIQAFLDGTAALEFSVAGEERYVSNAPCAASAILPA